MSKKTTKPKDLIYSYEGFPGLPPIDFFQNYPAGITKLLEKRQGTSQISSACISRKRNSSSEKVIVKIPFKNFHEESANDIWTLPHLAFLCIIDTNTNNRNGVLYSKTNFQVLTNETNGRFALFADYNDEFETVITLNNIGTNLIEENKKPLNTQIWGPLAEKYGICRIIPRLQNTFNDSTVGIVWDSDLGNHDDINYHNKEIFPGTNITLPKEYCIIYASADNKNAHTLCVLLSNNDKRAKT